MPTSRPSFKSLSFSLVLLMLRILSEQSALAAAPDSMNIIDISTNEDASTAALLATTRTGEKINLDLTTLTVLAHDLCGKKEYSTLLQLLHVAKTPSKEIHRFKVMLSDLLYANATPVQKLGVTILQSCYFIEDFTPSTVVGQIIKQAVVFTLNQSLPELNQALLDYHVMHLNFEKAAEYLHDDLPTAYLDLFHRLANRSQQLQPLESPPPLLLLKLNQGLPRTLPCRHPALQAALETESLKNLLFQSMVEMHTREETEELSEKQATKLNRILNKAPGSLTSAELHYLNDALHHTDNPFIKFMLGDVRASIAVDTIKKTSQKTKHHFVLQQHHFVLQQLLIAVTFDTSGLVSDFNDALYSVLELTGHHFNSTEVLLLTRYLLANSDTLPAEIKRSVVKGYDTVLSQYTHLSSEPLLLHYDAYDEKLIRQHYDEQTANRILAKEKTLSPTPMNKPTQQSTHAKDAVSHVKIVLALCFGAMISFLFRKVNESYLAQARQSHRIKLPVVPQKTKPPKTKKPSIQISKKQRTPSTEPSAAQTALPVVPLPPLAVHTKAIQAVTLSTSDKIAKLISNKKFPPAATAVWVKLPTTTLTEVNESIKDYPNDPFIQPQLAHLIHYNDELIHSKRELDALQKNYIALIQAYDSMMAPNEDVLIEFETKISRLQAEANHRLTIIKEQTEPYYKIIKSIESRIKKLRQDALPPAETAAEKEARLQGVHLKKQQKKAEKLAQAETEARTKEAKAKQEADRAALNNEKYQQAVFRRELAPDAMITHHFLYAHRALLVLNDIATAKPKDEAYLRDACILSCTQLYEALEFLSRTLFKNCLPNAARLSSYRNIFAHDAAYMNDSTFPWRSIAREASRIFFAFVDNHAKVKPGPILRMKEVPELNAVIPEKSTLDLAFKQQCFKSLCERYLAFHPTLKKLRDTHKKQQSPYQHEAIHLLVIAMRGLVMQIKEVGEEIGIKASHKHMAPLTPLRNQEAHNDVQTDIITLIELVTSIKALSSIFKPVLPRATPSQLGLYAPTNTPVVLEPTGASPKHGSPAQ